MTDIRKPRCGSLAYRPRKRAETQNCRVYWQGCDDKRVLGFAGYKVGMIGVSYVDPFEGPTKGQEVVSAGTVIEVPPLYVYGYRIYTRKEVGSEVWVDSKDVLKTLNTKKKKPAKQVDEAEIADVRLLVYAQPAKTSIGKKHVERFEVGLGGSLDEKKELAESLMGKEMSIKDVFKPGEFVDVVAVTKGKGWQGPVKRFGVSMQRPKATGRRRHVGTLGQWHPNYILYTVPRAGQMGYHKRTELNKWILHIGGADEVEKINPSSGFHKYGFVKNDYVVLKGSVPGPVKRLIKLRLAVRADGAVEPKLSGFTL